MIGLFHVRPDCGLMGLISTVNGPPTPGSGDMEGMDSNRQGRGCRSDDEGWSRGPRSWGGPCTCCRCGWGRSDGTHLRGRPPTRGSRRWMHAGHTQRSKKRIAPLDCEPPLRLGDRAASRTGFGPGQSAGPGRQFSSKEEVALQGPSLSLKEERAGCAASHPRPGWHCLIWGGADPKAFRHDHPEGCFTPWAP